MKIRNVIGGGIVFFCPACKTTHSINTNPKNGPVWQYSNNKNTGATILPSIKCTVDYPRYTSVCHFYITNNHFRYLNDCTHQLAGQTVEIPNWPYKPHEFGGIVE